jgi:hypothetical protein
LKCFKNILQDPIKNKNNKVVLVSCKALSLPSLPSTFLRHY